VKSESGGPRVTRPRASKAETHERILRAAMTLFAARGYERTSMRTIARRAGVSHSAVFWHFNDKETLFREAVRGVLTPFFEAFKNSIEHTEPRKRLSESLAAYERVVEENRGAIRSIVRWLLESEKLRAALIETLFSLHNQFVREVRGTFEELLGDDPDAPALAAAVVSLLDGNLLLAMLDPSDHSRELREVGLRALVRRALGEESGEE
jgi:AcrR family transcriptional regulator